MIHLKKRKKKKVELKVATYLNKKIKKNLMPQTYTMMVKKKENLKKKKKYEEGKKKRRSEEGEGNSN